MYLEKLIKELKNAKCTTREDRKNVEINIKICQMQIGIREKLRRQALKKRL